MEKKNLIIAAVVLLIVIGFIYWWNNTQKQAKKLLSTLLDEEKPGGSNDIEKDAFPLSMGSQGKKVEQLQLYLKDKKGAKFLTKDIDGDFGKKTFDNVKGFLGVEQVNEDLFKQKRMSDYKTFKYPDKKEVTNG